ncbi:hypothetical protein WR25_20723 [Diploscapter pachys]|uniref:L-aminoadipate-semialdehyde dehydrogenase-phosphopantetheinyl transferase n=1 Tax=Diploscapter pachys TaxID=2018661 RepID=A0A2A2KNK9_9BILA|nr:hypothetical protein WR25_20723 [Diploscapter pachys]
MSSKKIDFLRWAVSVSRTQSNKTFELNLRRAIQCIESAEVEKARRFHYKEDSIMAIISPILMRAAACRNLNRNWRDLKFERTLKGKPHLVEQGGWHFNISHQGDFVLLATTHVGPIDEMTKIKSQSNERMKWTNFYRYWCLKESVLKATGTGLAKDLSKVQFSTNEDFLHSGSFVKSTEYLEDGKQQPNWLFEESFVDNDHCAAVATILQTPNGREEANVGAQPFRIVPFEELLEFAQVVSLDIDDAEEFDILRLKPSKPF